MSALFRVLNLFLTLAHARAGGGHGYSGGHSYSGGGFGHSTGFSSGGSSGGADLFQLAYLYFRMVEAYPLVGVPLTVFLVYVVYVYAQQSGDYFVGGERISQAIAGAALLRDDRERQENLERLRARDGDFSETQFLARAAAAFLRIQQAWSAQDMAGARAFISDGVMERFSMQIAAQKTEKIRNDMSGVKVTGARVVKVESDPHFDALHVRFDAEARDVDVSLETGAVVRGPSGDDSFEEVWTFLRRPSAKTLKKPGLLEGFCPSCGSPLALADAGQCAACKSWVNSGEYDWVLVEITQACEWTPRGASERVPGYGLIADADPALNLHFLEDRASVVFWRWQAALAEASSAPLRPAASEDLCRRVEDESHAEGLYFRDAAVGGVEVLALEPGETMDRAHVSVRWSGESVKRGLEASAQGGDVLRQHVVVLERKAGAVTDARAGLVSLRCAHCGAPPASRDEALCSYCRTPFNDGSRHWVAAEIVPIGMWSRPKLAEAGGAALDLDWADSLSDAQALAVLVAAMMSDGSVASREREYLDRFARKKGIAEERIDAMIDAARAGHLQIPAPASVAEAAACLKGLVEMSLADGAIDEPEMKLMIAFGARLSLGESQVRAMVKETRLGLYRQAKKDLKAA